jgi:hypothetical protein
MINSILTIKSRSLVDTDALGLSAIEREYQMINTLPRINNLRTSNQEVVLIEPNSNYIQQTPVTYNTPLYTTNYPLSYSYTPATYYTSTPSSYSFYPKTLTYTPSLNVFNPLYSRKDSIQQENTLQENVDENIIPKRTDNTNKFQDVINEIKTLKIEIFGNPEESMDFYKRNRNSYDARALQRAQKIAKILELEELLDFYNSQHNKLEDNKGLKRDESTKHMNYNKKVEVNLKPLNDDKKDNKIELNKEISKTVNSNNSKETLKIDENKNLKKEEIMKTVKDDKKYNKLTETTNKKEETTKSLKDNTKEKKIESISKTNDIKNEKEERIHTTKQENSKENVINKNIESTESKETKDQTKEKRKATENDSNMSKLTKS